MSGEPESKTQAIDERHARILRLLDEYSIKLGLGRLQATNEVEKYLNLSQADIRRLTPEECGEAAYLLNRAALYVQNEINKAQADINWCQTYIDFLIAKSIESVGGQYMPHDCKKTLAIRQNDVAMKLQEIITSAKLRLDAMSFIPNHLRALAGTFEKIQYDRRTKKGD